MNGDDAKSIAAIGVFSAASFRERRTSARATWLHAHHDGLGFLVRFVVASTGDEQQRNSTNQQQTSGKLMANPVANSVANCFSLASCVFS